MTSRTKTFWVPALVSLTGSMAWRAILQRSFPQSEPLLNHAGLPLTYQFFWLAALPLFGAVSAHLSRRSGGNRPTACTAALFPSIVMAPMWMALAISMSHPSAHQWFGLFCGVMNWIVTPGIALSSGAWSMLSAQSDANEKVNPCTLNTRTRTFWLPALLSLTTAMVFLTISTLGALDPQSVARGWSTYVAYIPWLFTLPICGAAGAYLSRRAGGERRACLAAALFPVIAMTTLVGFLTLIGQFVFARPKLLNFSTVMLLGVILPGVALLSGAVPFVKAPRLQKS